MCVDSTRGYFLCGLKTGHRLGTGRCTSGSDHRMIRETGHSPTVICAAITSKMNKAKLPTHVEIESSRYNMVRDSVILLEQLRTIDKKRLKDKVCHLDTEILDRVNQALAVSLDLHS